MPTEPAPNTKEWSAKETNTGTKPDVVISGQVEVSALNMKPKLDEGVPGINPKILILDLTIVKEDGAGGGQIGWRKVSFQKVSDLGKFTEVEIRWLGNVIETIKVQAV